MPRYGRVFSEIPSDEPVFVIRGQDRCALVAIGAYVEAARLIGADDVADAALDWLDHIRSWQDGEGVNRVKVPDLPLRPPQPKE